MMKRRLLLLGGGHAHLSVLQSLSGRAEPTYEVILVTPGHYQNYSGMLPGWMAGHYLTSQVQIDLLPLLRAANVKLIAAHVIGIDANHRRVHLSDSTHIEYDLLSVDVGSEINSAWLELAGTKLLPVKPLDVFFKEWPKIIEEAKRKTDYTLAVVGGGAAGVELALAAQYAFKQNGVSGIVHLVASDSGLLQGHAVSVQKRISRFLQKAGVITHFKRAVGAEQGLLLSDGTTLAIDSVIAATGARAPIYLQGSGLSLDAQGYILVDRFQRSVSHDEVFAAGDVCVREDVFMARSGVHAVRAGPILAANLAAKMQGSPLRAYSPRPRSLYLLACGSRYAIASWGCFSAEGRWVWYWKDRIDRRFIAKFSELKHQVYPQK